MLKEGQKGKAGRSVRLFLPNGRYEDKVRSTCIQYNSSSLFHT